MAIKNNYLYKTIVAIGLITLAGCTHTISDVDSSGNTRTPVFPTVDSAVRSEGSYPNIDNLAQVKAGLTKAQLYELIGTPHFKEGIFRVREWDYIFHFRREGKTDLTCQYKILFDDKLISRSFYYKPADCLSQLQNNNVNTTNNTTSYRIKLHSDIKIESLFDFGLSTLNDDGVHRIKELAAKIKANMSAGDKILISGYADRIGSQEYNQSLSQRRADSIKMILIQSGIPSSSIDALGFGSSSPKVFCPGKVDKQIIACLSENRRIVVDVKTNMNTGKN